MRAGAAGGSGVPHHGPLRQTFGCPSPKPGVVSAKPASAHRHHRTERRAISMPQRDPQGAQSGRSRTLAPETRRTGCEGLQGGSYGSI
jgi:hypothetical protein